LRCLGHVINLAAKAFLYGHETDAFEKNIESFREQSDLLKELKLWRKRGPLGKLHNIIIFICRTPQRRERFANIRSFDSIEKGDFDHLQLVVDNATRWNSLYAMIERAIKLRDRIDRFCIDNSDQMHGSRQEKVKTLEDREHLLRNDVLDADDWRVLAETMSILEKFMKLTKRAEGTESGGGRGILSDYMTTLNSLIDHVRKHRDDINARTSDGDETVSSSSDIHLWECIVNCWTKLDEYFTKVNDTPAHYASVVTVPWMKWKYFEHTWKDATSWKDAKSPETWLPGGKKALETVWEEYRDLPFENPSLAGSKRRRSKSPSDFERSTNMALIYGENAEEDQLEAWIQQKPIPLDRDDTLVAYWLRQSKDRSTYQLARMALDMASIPAMSSECERVFSQAKLLITGQRHRLQADIIEATQCLRMWMIMDRKAAGTWKKGRDENWETPHELYNDMDISGFERVGS
jgi:hypothetical protein